MVFGCLLAGVVVILDGVEVEGEEQEETRNKKVNRLFGWSRSQSEWNCNPIALV